MAKEYKRREVQPLVVLSQQTFQLKRPKNIDPNWAWPEQVPAEVLFDPLATVSATYGVAFQTRFRDDENVLSSRPAIFVIDRDGVLRHMDSRKGDIREEGFFPVLDDLDEQRALITGMQTNDNDRREAVRIALAPIGQQTKTSIPVLVNSLKDEAVEVRAGAAAALYWIAREAGAAVPALSEALGDRDSRVRRLSGLALARIGPDARSAVPALIQVLADQDERVRAAVLSALVQIGPDAAAGLVGALKNDKAARIRAAAAAALPTIPNQGRVAGPALIEAMQDGDAGVRAAAALAIARLNLDPGTHSAALAALMAALKDGEAPVRAAAANGLSGLRIGAKAKAPAVPALMEALKDRDVGVRAAVADSFSNIGPHAKAAVPGLIAALKDSDREVRWRAAHAL